MARIKLKSAIGVERSCEDGFGGIDRTDGGKDGESCYDLCNLTISPDGSLRTRDGYAERLTLPGIPRAHWYGDVKGNPALYLLIGKTVYSADPESGNLTTLGVVGASSGEADIFWYSGKLYVFDGVELYCRSGSYFLQVQGYVPLYGKGWSTIYGGPVNEPINFLSNRIRINFKAGTSPTGLHFGFEFVSLDGITVNGKKVSLSNLDYSVSDDGVSIECYDFNDYDDIEVWLTIPWSMTKRSVITGCTRAFICGGGNSSRLCCWGSDGGFELFCSRPTDPDELRKAQLYYNDVNDLYFPQSARVLIGEGRHSIRAAEHHFDRYLIFTDGDTFCIDWNGKETDLSVYLPDIILFNSAIGASATDAAALCGNDPLTLYLGGIWRWHSNSGVRDECSATLISDPVAELIPKTDEGVAMLSVPARGEVWIADPDDGDGRVLIYNDMRRAWYTYTGIWPDKFYIFGQRIGFIRGTAICLFTEGLEYDIDSDGEVNIPVKLISNELDFGCSEIRKRACTAILYANAGKGKINLKLENENGCIREINFYGDIGGRDELFCDRASLGRYRILRYTVTADQDSAVKLNGICLAAK